MNGEKSSTRSSSFILRLSIPLLGRKWSNVCSNTTNRNNFLFDVEKALQWEEKKKHLIYVCGGKKIKNTFLRQKNKCVLLFQNDKQLLRIKTFFWLNGDRANFLPSASSVFFCYCWIFGQTRKKRKNVWAKVTIPPNSCPHKYCVFWDAFKERDGKQLG